MQTVQIHSTRPSVSTTRLLGLFAATMLLSALLLFAIQPMFTKMVLPMLGGSPSVWNTAMLFFQIMLLAGYGYAHLSSKLLTWRRQVGLHAALLSLAFLALPIAPMAGWAPPADEPPVFWLIGLLSVSIGLPFFVVSANAPLLQRWFAGSGHPSAADPYFLYGASNIGSIAALLAYPTIIQPLLGLKEQSLAWTLGYIALTLLIGLCALSLRSRVQGELFGASAPVHVLPAVRIGWRLRLQWIVFALVPSSLLLGVTTHISTDVAAVPLLWVLPLILYLLSFVVVFSRRPLLKHEWMVKVMPYFLVLVALNLLGIGKGWIYSLGLHLSTFFICTMVCHGELMKRRPTPSGITEFYLYMSIGGMLGGVFNALLAPVLFKSVIEYPIALVAACLLRPTNAEGFARHWRLDLLLPGTVLAALALPTLVPGFQMPNLGMIGNFAFLVGLSILVFSFKEHALRFALGIGAVLIGVSLLVDTQQSLLHERSFFGVHRVQARNNGSIHVLLHGTTIHGAQLTNPTTRRTHVTYYYDAGPFGQLLNAYADKPQSKHVGVIGLGAGALACFKKAGQDWTFYEIDPVVISIARDSRLFHYMSDCAPDAEIVPGDARLSLRSAPPHRYGILFLDAFSSDAVPIHLLTREALTVYLSKLTEDGIIVFHISNRHLRLAPVLAGLAHDAGLTGRHQQHVPQNFDAVSLAAVPAELVVMARKESDLAALDGSGPWTRLDSLDKTAPWTDDYSNIFSSIYLNR
jgi:hypothetical protein